MESSSGRYERTWVVALLTTAVLASCGGRGLEPRPGGIVVTSGRVGYYLKKVVGKQAPETLVAEDGTTCRVAANVFRSTVTGTSVRCNWE